MFSCRLPCERLVLGLFSGRGSQQHDIEIDDSCNMVLKRAEKLISNTGGR